MKNRLNKAGIYTPLELRYSTPEKLKAACKSIIGLHWYYRLHFQEVDLNSNDEYKNMSAMRMISKEQRNDIQNLFDILMMLCLTLEKRMVQKELHCKRVSFFTRYEDGTSYEDKFHTSQPLQDGMEIYHILEERQHIFQQKNKTAEKIINSNTTSIGIVLSDFIHDDLLQLNIFDNTHLKNNKVRKTVYDIKDKYGMKTIKRASELRDEEVVDDVIGFGSVKDVNANDYD